MTTFHTTWTRAFFAAVLALALPRVSLADNHPPVANAGPDFTVTAGANGLASVQLDGSARTDPDAPLFDSLNYEWVNSIPTTPGINPIVDLAVGVHEIFLTVTDSFGESSVDTVIVTVLPMPGTLMKLAAQDLTVECDGLGNITALNAWLAAHGNAVATSSNGAITWTNNYSPTKWVHPITGSAVGFVDVIFTATDPAGVKAVTTAAFRVTDTTAPTLVWKVNGSPVVAGSVVNVPESCSTITVAITAVDLAGSAQVTSPTSVKLKGKPRVTQVGSTFTVTRTDEGNSLSFSAGGVDLSGNVAATETIVVRVVDSDSKNHGSEDYDDNHSSHR